MQEYPCWNTICSSPYVLLTTVVSSENWTHLSGVAKNYWFLRDTFVNKKWIRFGITTVRDRLFTWKMSVPNPFCQNIIFIPIEYTRQYSLMRWWDSITSIQNAYFPPSFWWHFLESTLLLVLFNSLSYTTTSIYTWCYEKIRNIVQNISFLQVYL